MPSGRRGSDPAPRWRQTKEREPYDGNFVNVTESNQERTRINRGRFRGEFTRRGNFSGSPIASNPGAAGLKDISGVIVLNGGLPIRVGDEVIGSIGVGGAQTGDRDEACAKAGLDKVADQLK